MSRGTSSLAFGDAPLGNASLRNAPLWDVALGDAASSRVPPLSLSTRQDAASPSSASPNPPSTRFFSRTSPVDRMRHNLPHWEQSGTTCFATFRLADSLPAGKLEELRAARARWLAVHPTPLSPDDAAEYRARFEDTAERWLDAGHGECLLRAPEARRAVEDALRHFDGSRYVLHAFVVMPNHVHVLFTPAEGVAIGNILHSWKSFSAKTVNAALRRTGTVWEKESWDRFIRNRRHFDRTLAYIRSNPGKMDIPVYVAPALLEWLGDVSLGDAASSRVVPTSLSTPLGDAASSRVPPTSHSSTPLGDAASSRVSPTSLSPTRQDAASPNPASPDLAFHNATPKRKSLP